MEKKIILDVGENAFENKETESVETESQNIKDTQVLAELKAAADEFAAGLPEWDLIPPQVVVRRIRRNI